MLIKYNIFSQIVRKIDSVKSACIRTTNLGTFHAVRMTLLISVAVNAAEVLS